MKNLIGIDTEKADALVSELNDLLANYQLFYQNLRGFIGILRVRNSLNYT